MNSPEELDSRLEKLDLPRRETVEAFLGQLPARVRNEDGIPGELEVLLEMTETAQGKDPKTRGYLVLRSIDLEILLLGQDGRLWRYDFGEEFEPVSVEALIQEELESYYCPDLFEAIAESERGRALGIVDPIELVEYVEYEPVLDPALEKFTAILEFSDDWEPVNLEEAIDQGVRAFFAVAEPVIEKVKAVQAEESES